MTFAAEIAKTRPGETALRDRDQALTWEDVDRRLRPAINRLQAADLGPKRRVAIVAGNSVDTLLAYVSCTLAGASAVAVNSHLTATETAYILNDADTRAVFCDTTTAEMAATAARSVGIDTVIAWGDSPLPDGVMSWGDWGDDDAEPPTDLVPRPTLVYTSGTTGRPKGVELPPTSWVGGADINEHVARLAREPMVSHGRHLVVGPMYHSGPLASTRLFLGGAPVSILGKFDADALLTSIERDRIASAIMVPTHFQRLLALPASRRQQADISSLRFVLQVGAACPEKTKRQMIDWWGEVIWESYGASEVGTTCMISAAEWLAKPGSVGRSIPPFEAYIKGQDGTPAPSGTEGPLWFRDTTGHGIKYSNGLSTGSEFTLGEIGRMDFEGYVWITDRLANMVVSGGVNIYPAEVEQVLMQNPAIADVACFGLPDDAMGERLVALVVPANLAAPPSLERISAAARTQLAGYKIPREFIWADELPRTAVGKLNKRALRAYGRTEATESETITPESSYTR